MTIPTRNMPDRTWLHLGSSFMKALVALSSNTRSPPCSFLEETPQISPTQCLHMDFRSVERSESSERSPLKSEKCTHMSYISVLNENFELNNKGRTRSCLKVWGDQIKRNKRKRQHDQDTVFKKIQKATSIVLIFLNKGILPFVVSEVFLMFTQITISSSISSTSLFIVTRVCHTRFPIYSNNM